MDPYGDFLGASDSRASLMVPPNVQRARDVDAASLIKAETDQPGAGDKPASPAISREMKTDDPYANFLGVSDAKPPDQAPVKIDLRGMASPAEPSPVVPWLQKAGAAAQAGANVIGGTIGAVTGLPYGALEAAGSNAMDVLSGRAPGMDTEQRALMRARQFTPSLPAAMQTSLGQEYTENVGQAMQEHGPSLIGAGPALGMLGTIVKGAVPRASSSMGALADSFAARQAAERIDPNLPKPRYTLVNGVPQEIPAGGQTAPPVSPQAPPVSPPAVPGAAPTLAHATPELQEAVAASKQPIDPTVLARHVEAETLPVPMKITGGQATQDPDLISREMNGRGKEAPAVPPQFYQQQGQLLAKNMDAIRATAAPDVPVSASIVDHGQTLVDAYKNMDAPVVADISAKYKALNDANGGQFPLNGEDFVTAADTALSKQMKARYVPSGVAGDLEMLRQGGPMTYETFENLRTNLAAEARKAARNGDGNAEGAVNIVRTALESLPMTTETATIKPLADAARGAARARFEAIRADPAYKAAINDSVPAGEPSPLADKFFNAYVTKGARANVSTMAQNLSADPLARQTLAAGTLDQLAGQLKADPVTGNFSQSRYNNGLAAIAPKLGSLLDPTTAQQVQAVGNVAKNIQVQPRGSFVNNSNTAVTLMGEGAKKLAEHGTNMMFGGIPVGTTVRGAGAFVAGKLAARKATSQSLAPGAGMTTLSKVGEP